MERYTDRDLFLCPFLSLAAAAAAAAPGAAAVGHEGGREYL